MSVINIGEKNVFIGLYYSSTIGSFEWIDNTSFAPGDFASNTSGGQYPWKASNPDPIWNHTCVEIGFHTEKWNDLNCNKKNRILCNHCSGKLNKYFVIQVQSVGTNYSTAKTSCEQYGTTLAGIHTIGDQTQANIFSDITKVSPKSEYKDYLWIGYVDIGVDNYIWEDGMPGTQYQHRNGSWPWRYERPDDGNQQQNCVMLEWDSGAQQYLWNDKECNENYHALCNVPSELCEYMSMWTDINGNANFSNCQLYAMDSIVMIDGKQWNNINNLLVIDYAHSVIQTMINNTQTSKSGLIISECQNPLLCDHYFIGIIINDTHQTISLQFYHSNTMHLLSSTILAINISVFFIMETKIDADISNNNLLFNITIEYNTHSDLYITYNHNRNTNFLFDTYSGYIGIISENIKIHAKSLYISGTPLLIAPTPMPTIHPTYQPTDSPSKIPSISPTKTPTKIPSIIPSNSPTKYPTDSPTGKPNDSKEIIITTLYANTKFSEIKVENSNFSDVLMIVLIVSIALFCIVALLCVYFIVLYRKKKKCKNNNQIMVEMHNELKGSSMSSAQAIVTNSNKHICEIEKKKEKEKEKDKNSDNDEEMYEINETLGN
eukprot:457744_1